MRVTRVPASDWSTLSRSAHRAVFSRDKPEHFDRIDYAWLAEEESGVPVGYVTCRENDHETVYWQFGGLFKEQRGGVASHRCLEKFLGLERLLHRRITCAIENTNTAMLRLAMKMGFLIVGVRNFHGSVLLEHMLEFNKES